MSPDVAQNAFWFFIGAATVSIVFTATLWIDYQRQETKRHIKFMKTVEE